MPVIEKQTTINAPAEQVFKYVANFPSHTEWAAHRLQVNPTSDGPVGVGATFSCVSHQLGEHKGQLKVTGFAPNSKIEFEAEDDTGRFRHFFLLQEEGGSTRLTKGVEPLRLAPLFRILSPIATAFLVPRGLDGDLQRIKARLEGGPTA